MANRQHNTTPYALANKPSSSFSTISSAGSATSAATSRSGGSKLLFGEIDQSSDRSSDSFASVCSFVLSDSSTFLKTWLDDSCRENILSYLPKKDLSSLRLVGHDFSVRAAPALFSDLSITFKTATFTRPARLAALDRLGFYVKTLRFSMPHTQETFLPPLVEPDTGEELSFTYTPQVASCAGQPKYGDAGTTEILTRQYPALFHAATNVPAFVRAFSAFINLRHLQVQCPGYQEASRYRRSIVDFALISLRIAVERNCLNALDTLTLAPIHPGALQFLSPLLAYGATPRSSRAWTRVRRLTIHMSSLRDMHADGWPEHLKILQAYLRTFQHNLNAFDFRWLGVTGPLPTQQPCDAAPSLQEHPLHRLDHRREQPSRALKASKPLRFSTLKHMKLKNVATPAAEIKAFAEIHKRTLEELDLEDTELTSGNWNEALSPLTRQTRHRTSHAEIPIMLSPTAFAGSVPSPMERIESYVEPSGRPSLRLSKWLPGRRSHKSPVHSGKKGSCDNHLKRMLGGVLSWM
ncbi:hypothetical protein LTR10_008138 [Elasticomyces elasticus]|nr:hypothetical protein LTR10_008138 [Elasticomyces elasticus]KAK4972011.1 hypothetical protein LTR42_006516 [Elasticomyces elasticus]